MSGIILTRPQVSGIPGGTAIGVLIPASPPASANSNIVAVDSCDWSSNVAVKWVYTIYNATREHVVSGEVSAIYRVGIGPSHTISGIIGDRTFLPHKIDVISNGPLLTLQITNMSGSLVNPVNRVDYVATVVRFQLFG
jgi:hypothetical protein